MAKKTLKDLPDLHGKRVLIRVDFNVPLDAAGNVTSDRRIRAALPTIRYILDAGAAAIVMSHLGRPKGDPKKDAALTLDRIAERLGQLLGRPVRKVDQVVGPEVQAAAKALKPGEVLLLENLRFHRGEQEGDRHFATQLAHLADVYVNDAFGTCHRQDASMVAVPQAMKGKPRVVGLLVAKELEILEGLLHAPKRPFVAILGGAKVSDKIGFIQSLLPKVDQILIGGAMTYTLMRAQGQNVGNSLVESDKLELARDLLHLAGRKITLPTDHIVVERLDAPQTARAVKNNFPAAWFGVDIGPETVALYCEKIRQARTVIWNGPLGKYEDKPYSRGTRALAQALAQHGAVTVVGGGETADAVELFGLAEHMTHVSTGGGAFLEYIEGTPFPALDQIDDRNTS